MANPEHIAKLKEGVRAWNRWRVRPSTARIRPDLSGADISGADLRDINFNQTELGSVKLMAANLEQAFLTGADLNRANLQGANLCGASLCMANLTAANLSHARADGAKFQWTLFANTNLRGTTGLEVCDHFGPSSLGIDTFFRSGGQMPEVFLRGCGVPEEFISFARLLCHDSIEFYSCFISYSSKDQAFTKPLREDLRGMNLRCYYAAEDMKIGDRFRERIEESILHYDKLMVVLSKNSVKSRWVEREVNAALEREDRDPEKRTVLFPIRIDDAVMDTPQPWAAEIRRSRHIGDFRRWKDPDSYKKAFERLLHDLKADQAEASKVRNNSAEPISFAHKL